jgi:hypothetical protein
LPTWGDVLQEVQRENSQGTLNAIDVVRRRYLAQLALHTRRSTILYTTRWTVSPVSVPGEMLSIVEEDTQGFMEVFHGMPSDGLDLILHSPGGSAEATEGLVTYIRSKYNDVRVIVPHLAMSAATMLACSGNRIVMGRHSYLGPIDPQMATGETFVPAQAILDQFELAKNECQSPALLGAWAPILPQYGPALLVQCREAIQLSKRLVAAWLRAYMFQGDRRRTIRASRAARRLSGHQAYLTHGRHIGRDQARRIGLLVDDLEADQQLQDLVLSVFHASNLTFQLTGAVKLIENHMGRAFIKAAQVQVMAPPAPPPVAPPATPTQPPAGPP